MILDIGCGNHSPLTTKHWFPNCTYHGLDIETYNNSADDVAVIDRFYQVDLRTDSLSCVPDASFDLVIFSHVIEHIENGEEVVQRLSKKLKPGGLLYIECPSERSLTLPKGAQSLNFHDDPTHVRLYSLGTLEAACRDAGLRVTKAGVRRDGMQMLMSATIFLPKQILTLLRERKPWGPPLWDFLGFAHFVVAQKE